MKKTAGLFLLFGFGLVAADFWQKPYTEWSDKDTAKMIADSPWAKSASVSMGGPGGGGPPMPAGGGFGGGAPGGPQGGGGSEFGPGAPGSGPPSFEVVARWQSALPIREAFVRLKYGAEADKPEAKKFLEQQDRPYEIVLSGPMGMFLGGKPEDSAKALSEVSFLSSRRTGPIKASQIEVGKPGKTMDVVLVFPRSMPFTAEDKEVEFTTKLGASTLKYKFKLKDMVLNGKLEM